VTDLVGHRTRAFVEGTLRVAGSRVGPNARNAYRAPYRAAAHRHAIKEFVDDIPFGPQHPSAAAIDEVAERLRTLTAPTLLAWGARDPVFDDSFAHDLAARLPHADRHRYARAGHLSPEDADVAGTVDAWLRERVERPALVAAGAPRTPAAPAAEVAASAQSVGDSAPAERPVWAALEARASDDSVAFVDRDGRRTSFAELHARVSAIAAGLGALGLRPGQRVALLVPPSVELVAAIYGVWRSGGVAVVADRGLGVAGLGRAVRGSRVEWIIGPPAALAAARALRWAPRARPVVVGRRRVLGAVATLADLERIGTVVPPAPTGADPAAVVFTSGATGPAKGVRYRHAQLSAQRDALLAAYTITSEDRFVAAFAPFAILGPALGIPSTIPDVDVTKPRTLTSGALAAACASVDATIVFAAPAALANVVRTARPGERLDRVRLVLSAGAPVPVATLRAVGALCPAADLHTPYGMTECLPVADVSLAGIDAAGAGSGVCVGAPVTGATVMIAPLDFDAGLAVAPLPPSEMGEVLVRAQWASDGYDELWGTERDARPSDAAGVVWHRTGDVGHLDRHGRLWIEGRTVHVISTVSGPTTPVPVEVKVEADGCATRCAAVGVGPRGTQQVVVVVEDPSASDGLAPDELTSRVRAAVGTPVAAVLTVGALPVDIRHNAKIDRAAVSAWATAVLSGAGTRHRPGATRW
jgi:acyl-coenzyme A synthetase/AMP-(fatty) acid ligase